MKRIIIYILLLILLCVLHFSNWGTYVACNVVFSGTAALMIIVSWLCGAHFKLKSTVFIFIYIVWLLFEVLLYGNDYHMDRGFFFCLCWLIFFPMRSLFANKYLRKNIVWLFIGCAYFEMIIGFCQLFGLLGSDDNLFILKGTFGNPAMFAAFLSLIIPFALLEYIRLRNVNDGEIKKYVILIALILMTYFIAISYSRGAWISTLLSLLYIVLTNNCVMDRLRQLLATRRRLFTSIAISLFLVVGMAATLYFLKKDSSDGRLFIWKVAVTHPNQNVLLGGGIGHFETNYGIWQREYFANNGGSEHERYLADYVTCAYNEFLETYIDQGIIGVLLLITILFSALLFRPKHKSSVFTAAKSALIGFVTLCFVSYPTHCEILYLHLIVILALLYSHVEVRKSQKTITTPLQFTLFVSIVVLGLIPLWKGYSLCNAGRQKIMLGDIDEALNLYERAYPRLYNNGTFLFYYGSALHLKGNIKKSITILEKARMKSSDAHILLLLGDNYKIIGDTAKALEAYQDAIDCVPSRLYPRYQKVKLLLETDSLKDAYCLAQEILSMKEKIATTAGREIKEEMHKIIENIDLRIVHENQSIINN